MMLVNVVLIATLTAAEAPRTQPASVPASQAGPVLDDQEFDRLITDIDDPRFAVREQATQKLCELDASFLPRLFERYRLVSSEESRQRLRYVMETIFYQREIADRSGFVGIRLYPTTLTDVIDPRDGRKCYGILVVGVMEGLPADRAGVQGLDIIFGLNGQPVPSSPSTQKFISQVAATPPGEIVRLRVLRREPDSRRVTLRPGREEPSPTLGLKLSPPPVGLRCGVRVVEVAAKSTAEAAGVKVNDVIVAANGISITSGLDGPSILTGILQSAGPAMPVQLDVHSCSDVSLDVVVGRRSLEYLNPDDKPVLEAKFAHWWREQGGRWQPAPSPVQPPVIFPSQHPSPSPQPPQDRNPIVP